MKLSSNAFHKLLLLCLFDSWSSAGVQTHVYSDSLGHDTHVLCNSSHVTTFSVLVAVEQPLVRLIPPYLHISVHDLT